MLHTLAENINIEKSYGAMAYCRTFMGQLLQLILRHVFDHVVDSHAWQGPNPRKFTYWSHLGAMLCPQPPENQQPLLFNERAGQQ